MVMTSSQIASMNGAFAQQYMANMQYAGMIQPPGYNLGGYNTGAQNEGAAAGILNKGMAVGAPMATLGMGLMGLDPLSMGMRGGMMAHGMGMGVGGSIAAGAAIAAPAMIGMAGLSYMGNQMMSGAQQSQQFNQDMRGSFSFFNPGGTHGRGFSEQGIHQIGRDLRGMVGAGGGQFASGTGNMGTLGQFELGPSFSELGRLAAGMGRMGLADGVRNAKEFTDKFREMMKSVKTIAEDMGSTLEEAQKTMAAMKGSGVFRNQAGVSGAIRTASVAGGLATTEVTGMMNIGSQISRMFGGTGRQGAMGGIKALEQVGIAQQVGAVSEEDIYNTTGLTGAEGRRAFAQDQMMRTGSFLKGAKGRRLLASLAGKNGELDQSSVNDFLSGGMGTGNTMSNAYRNLGKVGRANFIRNEGRLRGAVMEEFGGMAPAMAMMGWAQQRGIDINSMGDREMLFMQRQLGLGRDEADTLVKMAKAMPDLMQRRREAKQDDKFAREHGLRAQNSGIEGIKRRLDAAKDSVNNEMQKVGQDVLESMTDTIAEWGNKLAGTYEERAYEGIRDLHRTATSGGAAGAKAIGQLTMGGKLSKLYGAAGEGALRENIGQSRYAAKVNDLQFSARMATATGMSEEVRGLLGSNADALKEAYGGSAGLAGLAGEDRMAAFKQQFGKDTALGKHFRGLDARGQAAFLQQAEMSMGMDKGRISETFQTPGLPTLMGGGADHTAAKQDERTGRSMLGLERGGLARSMDVMGKVGGGLVGAQATLSSTLAGGAIGGVLGFGIGALPGVELGNKYGGMLGHAVQKGLGALGTAAGDLVERFSGRTGLAKAAGGIFENKEMRELAFGMLTGDEGAKENMRKMRMGILGGAAERGGVDKLTDNEKATLGGLESIDITARVNNLINKHGGDPSKVPEAEWGPLLKDRKALVERMGGDASNVDKKELLHSAAGVADAARRTQTEIIGKIAKQVGKTAIEEAQVLQAGGVAELRTYSGGSGKNKWQLEQLALSSSAEKKLRASGGEAAVSAARSALSAQDLGRAVGTASTPEEQARLYEGYAGKLGQLRDELAGMDVKSLRTFGSTFAGTEEGDMVSGMIMRGQSMKAGKQRKGAAGAVASQLGLQMDKDQLAAMKGKSPEAQAAMIARQLGIGGDTAAVSELSAVIGTVGQKGGELKGADMLARLREQASPETKKKLDAAVKGQATPDEKILDEIKESNKHLKVLADAVPKTEAKLATISSNSSKWFKEDGET